MTKKEETRLLNLEKSVKKFREKINEGSNLEYIDFSNFQNANGEDMKKYFDRIVKYL